MLESLLFIFLICFGGLFLLISLIVLLIGIAKVLKLKKIALGIGVVPILCFGLIFFWYAIVVPSFNNNQMEDFAGVYVPHKSATEFLNENVITKTELKLTLYSDGTYKFDGIKGIELEKKGTWKTGGIDGLFEFRDEYGRLSEWASPSGSGKESALSFDFKLIKRPNKYKIILFIKKNLNKSQRKTAIPM
jgi:energy-coupling factor transporter transmembrane protein EcfT